MTFSVVFRGTLAVLTALACAYVIILTRNVWVSLLIAILVASAVRPAIMRLHRWGVPQSAAILLVYGGVVLVVASLLLLVLPPVINQFVGYLENENLLANRIISAQGWVQRTVTQLTGSDFELGISADDIRAAVSDIVRQVRVTAPSLIGTATGYIGEFVLIIIMGLYWITTRERSEAFLVDLAPLSRREQIRSILQEIEGRLGSYVRALVLISLIVGTICFVTLTIFRVPGAGTISFFYAVATAVPVVGGLIGVGLGTFLALLTSPTNAVIVLVTTLLLQQLENYFLTPRMMSKGTDFDPLLVIVFVSMGFTFGGVMGSLIAIPVAGIVSILIKHLVLEPRRAAVAPNVVDGGVLLRPTPKPDNDAP